MPLIIWIVAAMLIVLVLLLVKFRYFRHKMSWILIIFILVFVSITFVMSIAGKNLDLNSTKGVSQAGKIYLVWLTNSFNNLKVLTSQATKLDWNFNASSIFR